MKAGTTSMEYVMLMVNFPGGGRKMVYLNEAGREKDGDKSAEVLEPGATIQFTDGAGKYYGTITRSYGTGDGFVVDYKTGESK